MKQIKIFIGVVPDQIHHDGAFKMVVVDRVNETKLEYPIIIGDNAKVITVNENDMILFVPDPDAPKFVIDQGETDKTNVLQFVSKNIEKTLDNADTKDDNLT
jgi:hypothetical protein